MRINVPIHKMSYDNERAIKIFNMEIPTHIVIELHPKLIEKMNVVQILCKEHQLMTLSFLSNVEKSVSPVELFCDDTKIIVSDYTDFGKEWKSFDSNLFVLKHHSFGSRFTAEFLYVTSWTELSFSSDHFNIN